MATNEQLQQSVETMDDDDLAYVVKKCPAVIADIEAELVETQTWYYAAKREAKKRGLDV